MAKRYVLLVADQDLTEADRKELDAMLAKRHGRVKLLAVEGDPRAVIVKTTNEVAPLLREQAGEISLGGKRLESILTSGNVGKLKRRTQGTQAYGQVSK